MSEMFPISVILCLFTFKLIVADWVSEWMVPVQEHLNEQPVRSISSFGLFDKGASMSQKNDLPKILEQKEVEFPHKDDVSLAELKVKIVNTLQSAKSLAETLKVQIAELTSRENMIKDAIIKGKSGVTALTVSTTNQSPRSYIVREGSWTMCNGMIQLPFPPDSDNFFSRLFSEPRCIGKEIPTSQDMCVFNSVIKYETVPNRRLLEYSEDEYLCLRPSFNKTLEQYMSVPDRVMNETCTDGALRSLEETNLECGVRIITEYNFYPHKSSAAATLPLEYCVEKDGSCKLIVAWHVTNKTIENFEFLKNEANFKNFFLNLEQPIERLL